MDRNKATKEYPAVYSAAVFIIECQADGTMEFRTIGAPRGSLADEICHGILRLAAAVVNESGEFDVQVRGDTGPADFQI